jgi:hypothetical protein
MRDHHGSANVISRPIVVNHQVINWMMEAETVSEKSDSWSPLRQLIVSEYFITAFFFWRY